MNAHPPRHQLLRAGAPRACWAVHPDGDFGFNVESFRDFNQPAPKIAFGFRVSTRPRRFANRGEYQVQRNTFAPGVVVDSFGGTGYGGTGVYARATRRRVGRASR